MSSLQHHTSEPYSSGSGNDGSGKCADFHWRAVKCVWRIFSRNASYVGGILRDSHWFFENNAIVNLKGWLLKLEPLLCNKERQQKILMNDNHISEFKSVVPKLMNAVIVSCVKLVKISQHDRFENPWNLPVWSLPVKAWNPSNALHTRGVNLSKIWHRL